MTQQNRRQVSVRTADWQKASQLRDEVSKGSGCKVTITETISRALRSLEDELRRPWHGGDRREPSAALQEDASRLALPIVADQALHGQSQTQVPAGVRGVERIQRLLIRSVIVSVLSQFIARTMPERRLRRISCDLEIGSEGVDTLLVHLDDRKIPLFVGRVPMPMAYDPSAVEYEVVTDDR